MQFIKVECFEFLLMCKEMNNKDQQKLSCWAAEKWGMLQKSEKKC